jgi:hypothetical protein
MGHDGKDNGEPPLDPIERRRRIAILCCNFMRNLAFHRAGLHDEVRDNLLNRNHPQGEFWIQGHGNCLDTCVLDWCKLFADHKHGKHHWRRVVGDPERFRADLDKALGTTPAAFDDVIERIKHYRDKFVGHLDDKRQMDLPELEVARQATVFLYERLVQMIVSPKGLHDLPASTEELVFVYSRASEQAKSVYGEALRAAQQL